MSSGPRIALLVEVADPALAAAVRGLADHLRRCGVDVGTEVGTDPAAADSVLVFSDRPLAADLADRLLDVPSLLLAGPTLDAWRDDDRITELLGLLPGRRTPEHEIRLRPGPAGGEVTARMGGDVLLTDRLLRLDKTADDVAVLLTANVALVDHPVLTLRGRHGTCTVGSGAETVTDPAYRRLVHRWIRAAAGRCDAPPVRVGVLGYGAVGIEHARAIAGVQGLELAAVCDLDPARVAAAQVEAPGSTPYDDPDRLLDAADVDLVIVSTPPNTHAEWALRALAAGKSVVVEKPFCLRVAEADAMIAAAAAGGLALSVYQNRRWDADYLALKRAVRSGAIGTVFRYESFVGGYGHPCNFWHSEESISGGAIYDWGSHHLDWALDLLPQPVEYVSAHGLKRVWHDVTNADHTRVSLHFADGAEAEFVYSDLAAAPKPKWYVLGERGALVGAWRSASVLSRDAVGNLTEDRLAPAESPAALTLHAVDGAVTTLAVPPPPETPYHRELADLLLSGAPMSVTTQGSRRTTTVMAAATESIRAGGRPVEL